MQATIDARSLKPFTRALTCISKYGDEMMIHAGRDGLVLSALNLAKTAYCSFTYRKNFFQRFTAPRASRGSSAGPSRSNEHQSTEGGTGSLKCQLQTKSLLSVLKHRNTDKMAEKCELTIIDGVDTPEEELRENEDAFESRLVVRLYCKHGIVKTHRLLLNTPSSDEAPMIPSSDVESRILVEARAVKEIIEHFPNSRGARSDPELVWSFADNEVRVRSMEKGIDAKGKSQLATELKLGADEFDYYSVPAAPLTLGFFLREFNATITLADALNIPIDFRFTASAQPIYINAESDGCNMLFIIATNPVRGEEGREEQAAVRRSQANGRTNNMQRSVSAGVPVARKRALETDSRNNGSSLRLRPSAPSAMVSRQNGALFSQNNMTSRLGTFNGTTNFNVDDNTDNHELYDNTGPDQSQPLFLASQLSTAEIETLRESGLGIENMNAEEFAAMLDGEGEEVNTGNARSVPATSNGDASESRVESEIGSMGDEMEYDEVEEDVEMGPTQLETRTKTSSEKAFRPLFED